MVDDPAVTVDGFAYVDGCMGVDQGWPRIQDHPPYTTLGSVQELRKAMQAQKGGGGRVREGANVMHHAFKKKKKGGPGVHFQALAFTNGRCAQILTFVHTACRCGDRSWGFTNSLRSDEAARSRITTRAREGFVIGGGLHCTTR